MALERGVLLIPDLHLRKGHEAAGQAAITAILRVARENRHRLAAAVVLGDVLHDHAHLHHGPVAQAGALLAALSETLHRRVFVIPGNHDMASHADFLPPVHALSAFAHIPGVRVLHRPEVVSVPVQTETETGDVRLLLLPYVPSGRLREEVCLGLGVPFDPDSADLVIDAQIAGAVRAQRVAIALGHHTIRGAVRYGSAFHPAAGREEQQCRHDAWPAAWGLDLVSGHIHEPCTVGRVRYLGSVLQTAFGNDQHQPAVHVLHAPWRSDPGSAERVLLPDVPAMRTWRVAVDHTGMPVDDRPAPALDDRDHWRVLIEETSEIGGGQAAQRNLSPFSERLGALRKAGVIAAVVIVPKASAAAGVPLPGPDDDDEADEDAPPLSDATHQQLLAARFAAKWRQIIDEANVPPRIKALAEQSAERALATL